MRTITRVDKGIAAYYPAGAWYANKITRTRRGNPAGRPGETDLMGAVTDAGEAARIRTQVFRGFARLRPRFRDITIEITGLLV